MAACTSRRLPIGIHICSVDERGQPVHSLASEERLEPGAGRHHRALGRVTMRFKAPCKYREMETHLLHSTELGHRSVQHVQVVKEVNN